MAENIFERLANEVMSDAAACAQSDRISRDERERLEEERRERLEHAKVAITPDDVDAIARDRLGLTHSLRVVQAWRQRFRGERVGGHKPILALLGPRGRGKTVAGAWLIAAEGGRYISALELAKRLVSGHWRDAEWCGRIETSRVIVLDDVGTEELTDAARAAMFEFVNKRQALKRALTLITANLTKEEFIARYGERTSDRIEHVGFFIEAKGEDLRRKQAS